MKVQSKMDAMPCEILGKNVKKFSLVLDDYNKVPGPSSPVTNVRQR